MGRQNPQKEEMETETLTNVFMQRCVAEEHYRLLRPFPLLCKWAVITKCLCVPHIHSFVQALTFGVMESFERWWSIDECFPSSSCNKKATVYKSECSHQEAKQPPLWFGTFQPPELRVINSWYICIRSAAKKWWLKRAGPMQIKNIINIINARRCTIGALVENLTHLKAFHKPKHSGGLHKDHKTLWDKINFQITPY